MMYTRLAVLGLVGFGFFASVRLAWSEWTTGAACPSVGPVPACYVAFAGYLAMAIGVGFEARFGAHWARTLFYAGLCVAAGLALIGSALEALDGNVCPRTGGVPMCYLSIAMCVLIGGLFWSMVREPGNSITGDQTS